MKESDIQRQQKIWSKINFCSSIAALCLAVVDLIIALLNYFTQINKTILLAITCIIGVLAIAVIVVLFVSWLKLRRLKKTQHEVESTSIKIEVEGGKK